MAKTTTVQEDPRVQIYIPKIEEAGAVMDQTEHVTINGKTTIIQRGARVEVPIPVFEALKVKYPDLTLCLGAEILYHQRIADSISRGACRTLNGTRFVLIEFLPDDDGDYIVQSVESVAARGYTPILAHAERYHDFLSRPGYALSLAEQEIPIQLNVRSVIGGNGKKVKKFCHLLLKEGAAAVIASDAHDPEYADARLGEGFRYVSSKFGSEYARSLFCATPRTFLGLEPKG